jgi:hypothetical protein
LINHLPLWPTHPPTHVQHTAALAEAHAAVEAAQACSGEARAQLAALLEEMGERETLALEREEELVAKEQELAVREGAGGGGPVVVVCFLFLLLHFELTAPVGAQLHIRTYRLETGLCVFVWSCMFWEQGGRQGDNSWMPGD